MVKLDCLQFTGNHLNDTFICGFISLMNDEIDLHERKGRNP